MTWLSGSISRLIPALVGLALIGTGCGTQKRPAPPPVIRGYVNLDALIHRHPGWSGVSEYDAALHRLEMAARSLPPADKPDEKIATLPALPAMDGANSAVGPGSDVGQIADRLTVVQQSLLEAVRSRREMARLDQLRSQRDVWRREARLKFPAPTETTLTQPDLELQLLQANIETLTRTLDSKLWTQAPPPAPKREALGAKVAADRARLATLIAERGQKAETLRAQYIADRQQVRQARADYAQAQADALAGRLRADDERVIASQQARLMRQRVTLLEALASPIALSVPTAGDAGAETLPQRRGNPQATLARASLAAATAHLQAQRTRWIKYLYDDTQAAARDAAGQRNWDVTFGPPRPGDRDLTQPLAQALASGVWQL
ncbi:MAG: hypothetical protein M3Y13_15920 [Armatimonadota bacterium]|nr:hypothetical protein [Armatimonadota bacterium]